MRVDMKIDSHDEHCEICGEAITAKQASCYVEEKPDDDFDHCYHESCYQRRRDLDGARRALADFEKNGGATLEELRRELGLTT